MAVAREACEAGTAGPAPLAVACVALAVGAPVMLMALSRAARTVTGVALGRLLLPGKLTSSSRRIRTSPRSRRPTWPDSADLAACAVPGVHLPADGRVPRAIRSGLDGGIVSFKPRMQYSAMTFAVLATGVTFDALYRPSVSVRRASDDDPAGRSGPGA